VRTPAYETSPLRRRRTRYVSAEFFFHSLARAWQTGNGTSRAISPLKPKGGLTPISCHAVLDRSACAPIIKERRMRCINATSLHRKSGQMGHPAFVASKASSHADCRPSSLGFCTTRLKPCRTFRGFFSAACKSPVIASENVLVGLKTRCRDWCRSSYAGPTERSAPRRDVEYRAG
jgi:hypothetical protein